MQIKKWARGAPNCINKPNYLQSYRECLVLVYCKDNTFTLMSILLRPFFDFFESFCFFNIFYFLKFLLYYFFIFIDYQYYLSFVNTTFLIFFYFLYYLLL